jgi:uncharacterized protein
MAGPRRDGERIASLDLIRGVAVLGIVFANIVGFAHPPAAYVWPSALPGGGTDADRVMWLVQYVLVDHKMRGLFTILFGAGIALFMERAWAQGHNEWLQVRRLLWLLVFGAAHFYFVWDRDILQTYAFWGLATLLAVRKDTSVLFGLGLTLYLAGTIITFIDAGSSYFVATFPDSAAGLVLPEQLDQLARAESETLLAAAQEIQRVSVSGYWDAVRFRIFHETGDNFDLILSSYVETPGLILLGMALYRSGFFSGVMDDARLRKWGWIGFGIGVTASALVGFWAYSAGFPLLLTVFVFEGVMMLPRLAFILGLAALLVVGAPRARQGPLGQRLIAAGRMAFSNYLGTSLIMLAIFPPWGLGLFGTLHRLPLLAIVLAVWTAMLLWSKPWLERYRYGPLEWLWRCLTYWRLFPLKR